MLNRVISFALQQRLFVAATAAFLLVYGTLAVIHMPVDVFPDLNRPTVTVMTEAPGLAPEEVEALVTLPLESLLNGSTGVQRVRSVSGIGLSIIFVEFGWGTSIYTDRQIVAEKLQMAQSQLPSGVAPVMGPISSIMGEIMLLAVHSKTGETGPMELRTLADWVIRRRLMSVPGVSQVINIGGQVKQYQVLVNPTLLRGFGVTLDQVVEAAEESNKNTAGGFLESAGQEYVVRNVGRVTRLDDLANGIVAYRNDVPIRIRDVARVTYGARIKRGDSSLNAAPAVILSLQKQPGANTVTLTRTVEKVLEELKPSLPKDVAIEPVFKQSNFIEAAVRNVEEALRDGGILVAIVLFLFLLSFRTTFITLTAIPLSFITAALLMKSFGISINTMTLGGLAVAIGELVDDAVVDVENVFRRLKENRHAEKPKPAIQVVFAASSEIRNSIVYATIIIALVFMPLFFLGGVEGRLFMPLGFAYIVSLMASLLVSLTVTPALCLYLLPKARLGKEEKDSPLVQWLKERYRRLLTAVLEHPRKVLVATAIFFLAALSLFALMGREFLPPFNEGSLTINILAEPGTALSESNRLGAIGEKLLLTIPEIRIVGRRTGRAELDEHAEGVHYSEIEAELSPSKRSRDEILGEIRDRLSVIPGVVLNIGQPISHRLDHLLSGIRAQIAVKLFGTDLADLRKKATEIEALMGSIPGVADLSIEKQVLVPQVKIEVKREEAGRYGLEPGHINEVLELALNGKSVSQVLEGQRTFDIFVRYDEPYRKNLEEIKETAVDLPSGDKIPIRMVADVKAVKSPNQVSHDNTQRRIVIQCNVQGKDLGSVVSEIQRKIKDHVTLPEGYFVTYEGQFQAQQQASRQILLFSLVSIFGIFLILYSHFRLARIALQVMANLPMAVIGGVIAIFLSGGTMSIASLLGFITVFGIVSRNGIMMVSHFLHLMRHEGEEFTLTMITRGAMERLVPILMTALTAALGLIPLAFARGAPGKEILQPLAVVILGGLISSTFLNLLVTPAIFWLFGKPAWQLIQQEEQEIQAKA
ncbi:MAG: efflux RND transporter permease subunit [Armatimonadetes bacterium]|nr:efflux RND transporter permease subunit [Armatimonadota bacterium]